MMKNILILTITLSILSSVLAYSVCPSGAKTPSSGGCYGTNCECAQGVQYACSLDKVTIGTTSTWKRGSNIADICRSGKGDLYKNAAIATFYGTGNTYNTANSANQHAAIFLSCSGTGSGSVNVNDQWKSKGKWGPRTISYKDATEKDVNNSRYFYLIEK